MMFKNIKFILIQTTHPGNIGAAARAIKNMGFEHLILVNPLKFPDEEATARASGAEDILRHVQIFPDLNLALNDCQLIFGLSARERKMTWPTLDPETAALKALAFLQWASVSNQEDAEDIRSGDLASEYTTKKSVAFVFGAEKFGLTNEQLEKCQYQITIPANPLYSSLNLAQSVQIMTYELRKAFIQKNTMKINNVEVSLVNFRQMEGFYTQLEKVLSHLHFLDPVQSPHLMSMLRRLFNKSQMDQNELNILRGILTAIEKSV